MRKYLMIFASSLVFTLMTALAVADESMNTWYTNVEQSAQTALDRIEAFKQEHFTPHVGSYGTLHAPKPWLAGVDVSDLTHQIHQNTSKATWKYPVLVDLRSKITWYCPQISKGHSAECIQAQLSEIEGVIRIAMADMKDKRENLAKTATQAPKVAQSGKKHLSRNLALSPTEHPARSSAPR